jgi:hypothetical protein
MAKYPSQVDGKEATLHVVFTKLGLFWCRDSPQWASSQNPGALPTTSLAVLLQTGVLRDESEGGRVSRAAKAALALSLGRCLLHLFKSPWTQKTWTAARINFLCRLGDSNQQEVDISKPHVECNVATTEDGDLLRLTVADCSRFLTALAGLLVEIETGQPLASGEEVTTANMDRLLRSSPHRSKDDFRFYKFAVRGSVNFGKAVDREVLSRAGTTKKSRGNLKSGATSASLDDVRKVMYDQVVKELEIYHSKVPGRPDNDNIIPLPAALASSTRPGSPSPSPIGLFSSKLTRAIDTATMCVQNLLTSSSCDLVHFPNARAAPSITPSSSTPISNSFGDVSYSQRWVAEGIVIGSELPYLTRVF